MAKAYAVTYTFTVEVEDTLKKVSKVAKEISLLMDEEFHRYMGMGGSLTWREDPLEIDPTVKVVEVEVDD